MSSVLSFVGKSYAKLGFRFYFEGINPNCPKKCPFYATCQQNLKPKTVYEVVEIKDRTLECPEKFHHEPMVLVRLEKPQIEVSMHNKDIYEGSIINFIPVSCDRTDCPYIDYCEPEKLLIKEEQRAKILETTKKINECPRGFHLSIVQLIKKEK